MSVGVKIAMGLDRTRFALGGAMFGSLGSSVLGSATSLGRSMKRDLACATIGFLLFLWMLIDEARKEARRRADASVELDPPAAAENH